MLDNLSLLTYTHSSCLDLHDAYFGRIKKFFSHLQHSVVTCNIHLSYPNCIVYDEGQTYSTQVLNALQAVTTDFVIYSQEDYILYDHVWTNKISNYIRLMSIDPTIGFIRLIKSGVGNAIQSYNDELWFVDSNNPYYFSTQVSIWRKQVLIDMHRLSNAVSIFDEEKNSPILADMGVKGLYSTLLGKKVGGHNNSLLYPYIATAKVKGRWNVEEYPSELQHLFDEYHINTK